MSDDTLVVETVPVETNEPVVNEEVIESDVPETPKEEPAEEPKAEPVPKGVQKRIDRAVRDKYEAQARAKMLEERLNQLEQRQTQSQQPVAQQQQNEPKLEDFSSYEDYISAKAEYIAEQRVTSTLREAQQRSAAEKAQVAHQSAVQAFVSRVATATAELPDFEEVIAESTIPMPQHMEQAIYDSEVGPHLAYYLATHEDEALALTKMNPISAVRSLGRIEAKIENGFYKKAQKSNAPEPIVPAGTKTKVTKNPSEMTDAEFAAWRKTYIKNRH